MWSFYVQVSSEALTDIYCDSQVFMLFLFLSKMQAMSLNSSRCMFWVRLALGSCQVGFGLERINNKLLSFI
jgi:hypothetical protein